MTVEFKHGWWRVYGASPYHVPAFKTETEAIEYMANKEQAEHLRRFYT